MEQNIEKLIDEQKKRTIETIELIGKTAPYIKRAMRNPMIKSRSTTMMTKFLKTNKNSNGRPEATTRLFHYANTAAITRKIVEGIFENKMLAKGAGMCALLHDLQGPYAHAGEDAGEQACKVYNQSRRLHNIGAAIQINYRYAEEIKNAICFGLLVEEEKEKSGSSALEAEERLRELPKTELLKRVNMQRTKNAEILQRAIDEMTMTAANHNGERGTATIVPDRTQNIDSVMKTIEMTYLDPSNDYKLIPCNMIQAIVKVADQISSIPFDIIDAKRAGIEDEIFKGWAEPISIILGIDEEEAAKRLEGNNKELEKLVKDLQESIIQDVINSSTQEELHMSLEPYVYGLENELTKIQGLRTFNAVEHLRFTADGIDEAIIKNAFVGLTEKLIEVILDDNRVFPVELNALFKSSRLSQTRQELKANLINGYNGDERLKDFYKYATDLSEGEYYFNKRIVKAAEVKYYRKMIEEAIRDRSELKNHHKEKSDQYSIQYLVETFICEDDWYEYIQPKEDGEEYTDEEIKTIIEKINDYLLTRPELGKRHLTVETQKTTYDIDDSRIDEYITETNPENKKRLEREILGRKFVDTKEINTDEQIAARIALNYIDTLDDRQFIDLAYSLGLITDKQKEHVERPYKEYSMKREGGGVRI